METFHPMPLDDTRRNELVFWTNNSMHTKVLEQNQKYIINKNHTSLGVKECPLLLMMSTRHIIMPLLNMLLGLENKVRKKLFDHAHDHIDSFHAEEM